MKREILGLDKVHRGKIAGKVYGDDEVSWRVLHPDSSSLPKGRKRLLAVHGRKPWGDAALGLTIAGGTTNRAVWVRFSLQNCTGSDGSGLAEQRAGTPVNSRGDRLQVGCTRLLVQVDLSVCFTGARGYGPAACALLFFPGLVHVVPVSIKVCVN